MRSLFAIVIVTCTVSLAACSSSSNSAVETASESPAQIHAEESVGEEAPKTAGHADHSQRSHSGPENHGAQHSSGDAASASHGEPSIAIGDRVPDFEVMVDGKSLKLSELRPEDGVIALTFWCSFCHSCRDVEKDLDKLASEFKGQATVIAVDASAGETRERVDAFAKKNGLTLPIALDPTGESADIFGTRVTTTTVVIDRQGVLRYRGQFGDARHTFAEDALTAVLAGTDLKVSETRQKG